VESLYACRKGELALRGTFKRGDNTLLQNLIAQRRYDEETIIIWKLEGPTRTQV